MSAVRPGARRRLLGVALAGLLLAGYAVALRPARLWAAEHVAYPLLQQVRTSRADAFSLVRLDRRPDAVFAVPRAALPPGADADAVVRASEPPQWAAPVGVIFLLPAMFLIGVFPTRPYWAYLLAYHLVLGVVAFGVFALGLGWWPPAFGVYTFARTYLAETVSFVVPLLLALAARGRTPAGDPDPTRPDETA